MRGLNKILAFILSALILLTGQSIGLAQSAIDGFSPRSSQDERRIPHWNKRQE